MVIDLKYLMESNMKALRPKWQAAKTKHDAVLKAKKIAFSKGLGKLLDKRHPAHKTIQAFKAGGSALIVTGQLNAFKTNGKAIKAAADSYLLKIKGLGDPAETELRTVLNDIVKAANADVQWANQKLTVLKTPKKK
jgi:hypothetical protein